MHLQALPANASSAKFWPGGSFVFLAVGARDLWRMDGDEPFAEKDEDAGSCLYC